MPSTVTGCPLVTASVYCARSTVLPESNTTSGPLGPWITVPGAASLTPVDATSIGPCGWAGPAASRTPVSVGPGAVGDVGAWATEVGGETGPLLYIGALPKASLRPCAMAVSLRPDTAMAAASAAAPALRPLNTRFCSMAAWLSPCAANCAASAAAKAASLMPTLAAASPAIPEANSGDTPYKASKVLPISAAVLPVPAMVAAVSVAADAAAVPSSANKLAP